MVIAFMVPTSPFCIVRNFIFLNFEKSVSFQDSEFFDDEQEEMLLHPEHPHPQEEFFPGEKK